jgi:geranylgeranyl diphosphate synthase type I
MYYKIKKSIERNLASVIRQLDKTCGLSRVAPVLAGNLKDFAARPGKRVRPILFVTGYLGFAKARAANLYKSAVSFELLHDFLLIHDDIIDRSPTRRGKPSMHKMFARHLQKYKDIKFDAEDLAIVAGDVLYAQACSAFLSIKEKRPRKEKAFKKFIQAAIYTATGEFIELLSTANDLGQTSRKDIYRIYDYKTAHYTFAAPLSCGAILAGAGEKTCLRLYRYGIYLGRAFQIGDDILGIFGREKKMGKSVLSDLEQAKRTILIWYAYRHCGQKQKRLIKRVLAKEKVTRQDLFKIRYVIRASGALDYARREANALLRKAQTTLRPLRMRVQYKAFLSEFTEKLLNI